MNKLRLKRSKFEHSSGNTPKVVSIISGKGGVGKSVLAFNFAECLASLNGRILLVDADLNFGNLHIFANAKCDFGFKEFYNRELSLKEAVTKLDYGFDLLPSLNISPDFVIDKANDIADLMNRLRIEGAHYDLILIDHSSGLSKLAAITAYASDINLIVMVPELTSISDCYGLFKYLMDADAVIDCRLLINRTESKDEGKYIFSKFCAISERFIEITPSLFGFISEDEAVQKSLAAQKSLSSLNKKTKAGAEIMALASKLLDNKLLQKNYNENLKSEIINKTAQMADIKE